MHTELPGDLKIRNAEPADHPRIIGVMKDWWGGRDLTHMLPRLFLTHFCDTSFLMEKDNELAAFLIGFLSQSRNDEGYIHFVGVNPEFRGMGIGTYLYNRFYEICIVKGRKTVRSCTSPVNKGSIVFHAKMGFEIEKGNAEIDGVQVTLDYNKPNDDKVLFRRLLDPPAFI
jgi:predicted GNAT superfamily acetyltransferase